MKLISTPGPEGYLESVTYARTAEGKIDYKAYKNLKGIIHEKGLSIAVRIIDARRRYGHLDLKVTPLKGAGETWVERKNIVIPNDPALEKGRRIENKSKRTARASATGADIAKLAASISS